MTTARADSLLSLKSLKARHESVADELPVNLQTRTRRALSWLERAEMERDDRDAAFIFYWIAFDAVCAGRWRGESPTQEDFKNLFQQVADAEGLDAIRDCVLDGDFFDMIVEVVANPYVFEPFWDYFNAGAASADDWQNLLIADVERVSVDLENGNVVEPLATLFERLYVVRNQLLHGEATWNRYVNRSQVENGVEILATMVPALVALMMDAPKLFDHPSLYPSVESDTAQTVEDVSDYALASGVLRRVRDGRERVFTSEEVRASLGLED